MIAIVAAFPSCQALSMYVPKLLCSQSEVASPPAHDFDRVAQMFLEGLEQEGNTAQHTMAVKHAYI